MSEGNFFFPLSLSAKAINYTTSVVFLSSRIEGLLLIEGKERDERGRLRVVTEAKAGVSTRYLC